MSFTDVASQFASSLSQRDYSLAQSFLSESLKAQLTAQQIQQNYEGMTAASNGAALTTEVVETLTDWPDKQSGDVGWAYVAINGDTFSEAVTLTLCEEQGNTVVRDVVWGRP
jgi:hypothetical protein